MTQTPLAVTLGEPAGIGPDLMIQIAQGPIARPLVVFSDPRVLQERAEQLRLPLKLEIVDFSSSVGLSGLGKLFVYPLDCPAPIVPGKLDAANAAYVLETLDVAIQACMDGRCSALVTGPVNKAILNSDERPFTGHTEYLAEQTNTPDVLMMFASPLIYLALTTTHIPLHQVPDAVTPERIFKTLSLFRFGLREYAQCPRPKIALLGLNPHAGEEGLIGTEEMDCIAPVMADFVGSFRDTSLTGPIAADTAFMPRTLKSFDGFVAHYHDQGLAPLKALCPHETLNVTVGLPFLRVSVDHGVALTIAGTGQADPRSFAHAIRYAASHAGD